MISEFRESFARNVSFPPPWNLFTDYTPSTTDSISTSIDYFLQRSLDNAKDFGKLRQGIPGILSGASSLINEFEGDYLCNASLSSRTNVAVTI